MVTRKSRAEIERMRRAGAIVAEVLDLVEGELKPGVSTAHLDRIAERHIRASGAVPSFLDYPGVNPRRPFPGSICVSIDDEIVHGVPGERTIDEGQIVSIDAGAMSLLIRVRRHSHAKRLHLVIGFSDELPKRTLLALAFQRVDERRIELPEPVDQRLARLTANALCCGSRRVELADDAIQNRVNRSSMSASTRREPRDHPFEVCRKSRSRT